MSIYSSVGSNKGKLRRKYTYWSWGGFKLFFWGGGLAKICVMTKPLVINIALNTKLQFIYVVIEL